jgi:hypothetical protein
MLARVKLHNCMYFDAVAFVGCSGFFFNFVYMWDKINISLFESHINLDPNTIYLH